ncbi:hypothetical protein LEP1GSC007_3238 [Leptospira interrogans serovar Bulgarica str. Mallika]|nr:hypothetical protein LEP1GSC007_3238 [Leptospira interrogans serovar Bulgarica str. Mallika]
MKFDANAFIQSFLKIIRIYLDNTLFLFKMPILIVLIHFLDN